VLVLPRSSEKAVINDYILLRVLIGFLGEKDQYGWWDTSFLSSTGRQFLAINFPRSPLSAGCTAVSEAAKRVHDSRIGRGGAFHLYRLPPPLEESLHEQLIAWEPQQETTWLDSREAAMKRLHEYFSDAVDSPEGPVQVGSIKGISTSFALKECAKHYHDAFLKGKQSFPYFAGD